MEAAFCVDALEEALRTHGRNLQQRSRLKFTSEAFTGVLKERDIAVSIHGRARAVSGQHLHRTTVALAENMQGEECTCRITDSLRRLGRAWSPHFQFYNYERPHQSLEYRTPADLYRGRRVRP